ncbi:MAG: lamin tail domain-containing protein [Prevotella sp.]|nr:lamin tail domain-containing protein [Prevotella sp.]
MIASTLATAVLVINELMASNAGAVMSPAINFDSWIELYNPGDKAVNLSGMYLSDDASNLKLWRIPSGVGSVPAKGFKVIWLGSDDIKPTQAPFHLDCDGGSIYLSDATGQLLVSEVYPEAMSRTAWARTTDGGEQWGWTATPTPDASNATATFASERLDAPKVSVDSRIFSSGTLQVKVDIPEGATLMYTTDGSLPVSLAEVTPWTNCVKNGNCEGSDASCLVSKNGGSSNYVNTITDGAGVDGSRGIKVKAVANASNEEAAQFYVYTPDRVWTKGEKYRFRMKVRADKAATVSIRNYKKPGDKIGKSILGGTLQVTTEWKDFEFEGTLTAEQAGEEQQGWGWWTTTVYTLQAIGFNLNKAKEDNNFYFDNISWEVYDNSITSQESKDGKFSFSNTTALTVRLFKDGFLPSVPVTRSYIKTGLKYTLPVVSIVGDQRFFTDPKIGIDCDGDGTNGKTGNGQDQPRNYNQDWDRPVNFSYISPKGEMLLNQDVLISVSGGWTRSQRYRSFKLKANKVFDGQNRYDYSFFEQKPYIRNKTVVVRNGGNDVWTHNARFLDPALETMILRSGIDVDVQSYQPVIEYVNGELRGVLNLREPNNDKYAYANFGYDDEELDAFENLEMKNGDDVALKRIFELSKDINADGAYEELKTLLDIDEFINYMACEMYLDNTDWPDNNLKAYRSRNDGRYRFVSFDLDYAFDLRGSNSSENPFTFFYKFRNDGNINQEFVQFFLNMLNHDEFRRKFIDTFCIVAGSVFEPTRANAIATELLNKVKPMCQLMKQQGINDGHDPDRAVQAIKDKLSGRSSKLTNYMKQFSQMKLSSSTRQSVKLKSDTEGAHLFVNGINVPYAEFNGQLFTPVTLRAEAPAGYTFAGWQQNGAIVSTDQEISLPTGSVILTATFTPDARPVPPVRINEVSSDNGIYVNEYFKRNDWVELYNTTNEPVDVAGMYITDNPDKLQKYQIAGGDGASTVIPAHSYAIIWCDKLEPQSQLHASFKLAAEGDEMVLSAADGSWEDHFVYGPMKSDETAGRYPDGTDNVITMNVPTIAHANITSSYTVSIEQPATDGISDLALSPAFSIQYAAGRIIVSGAADGAVRVSIVSLAGQQRASLSANATGGRAIVSTGQLTAGAYAAVVTDARGHRAVCKFVKE